MKPNSWFQIAALTVSLVLGPPAFGQTGNGKVQGTVTGTSGAVIPAAQVTLVNSETNQSWTAGANDTGFYLFPAVPPGAYKLTVRLQGMADRNLEFIVQVGQTVVAPVRQEPCKSRCE